MAFDFNKIYVIESLISNEKTGRQLYDDVIRWFKDLRGIGTEFHEEETKEKLIYVLEQIASVWVKGRMERSISSSSGMFKGEIDSLGKPLLAKIKENMN